MTRELAFVHPLAGLPGVDRFVIDAVPGAVGLHTIRGSDAGPRLFVIDAAECLPGYSPVIDDAQAQALALERSTDAEVYVVVNPSATPTTVNLLAPVVVNRSTDRAAQVILEGQQWAHDAVLGEVLGAR